MPAMALYFRVKPWSWLTDNLIRPACFSVNGCCVGSTGGKQPPARLSGFRVSLMGACSESWLRAEDTVLCQPQRSKMVQLMVLSSGVYCVLWARAACRAAGGGHRAVPA